MNLSWSSKCVDQTHRLLGVKLLATCVFCTEAQLGTATASSLCVGFPSSFLKQSPCPSFTSAPELLFSLWKKILTFLGMQVAKLLGEKWRALDDAGKADYQATAAQQAAALKQQQQQPSQVCMIDCDSFEDCQGFTAITMQEHQERMQAFPDDASHA